MEYLNSKLDFKLKKPKKVLKKLKKQYPLTCGEVHGNTLCITHISVQAMTDSFKEMLKHMDSKIRIKFRKN